MKCKKGGGIVGGPSTEGTVSDGSYWCDCKQIEDCQTEMRDMGWIGVDLDGTLAEYHGWDADNPTHIGKPIPLMVERVKRWIAERHEVRIMTARATEGRTDFADQCAAIHAWCKEHIGTALRITNQKDYNMIALWDDRVVQVIPNTGRRADGKED